VPIQSWSKKSGRQYSHIKDSLIDRDNSSAEGEDIDRTVDKERAGEANQASRSSLESISSGRRSGLRSQGWGGRTRIQLYDEARAKIVPGRSSMSKAELERAAS
jgi:hypothetical protein